VIDIRSGEATFKLASGPWYYRADVQLRPHLQRYRFEVHHADLMIDALAERNVPSFPALERREAHLGVEQVFSVVCPHDASDTYI